MPPYTLDWLPTGIPHVPDHVNLITIATQPDGSIMSLEDFNNARKVELCNVMIALGVKSQNPSANLLRDKVHPAYVRQKEQRLIHARFANVLLAGAVALKEYAEDCMIFLIEQNVTSLNYKRRNQDTSTIAEAMLYKVPTRLVTLPSPEFRDLMDAHCHEIALLIPSFLNSRRTRARWSSDISPFDDDDDDEFGTQKHTFMVHVHFPEDVAGRCIGYAPADDDGDQTQARIHPADLGAVVHSPVSSSVSSIAQVGQRLSTILALPQPVPPAGQRLSAILSSPPSAQAAQSNMARTPGKSTRFADEVDEFEHAYQDLDLEDIFALVSASQNALARVVDLQKTPSRPRALSRAATPAFGRAAIPAMARMPVLEDDESKLGEGAWQYLPQEAGYASPSPQGEAGPSHAGAQVSKLSSKMRK